MKIQVMSGPPRFRSFRSPFDHRCNVLWEEMTRHGYELPADSRLVRQHRGHGVPHGPAHPSLRDTRA